MPLRVYRGKSQFEYRPPGGKTVNLCKLTATQEEVWEAFAAAIKKPVITVDRLADEYFRSRVFIHRKPGTQRQYRDCWKMLAKVWTGVDATRVQPKHVRQWMDARGELSEVSANRELAVLANIFSFGYERGKVKINPCKGVKRFPEEARRRYIEDDEYYQFLALSPPLIQVLMELSYLQGSRGQEVRLIKVADVRQVGVFIKQGKTGKEQIKGFSERLQDAVTQAQQLRSEILAELNASGKAAVLSPYLLVNRFGQPYTASGLKTIWARNRARIKAQHGVSIDWTFHDIKAKGISDYEGDKRRFAGHKTQRAANVYDRRTEVVPTVQSERRPLQR